MLRAHRHVAETPAAQDAADRALAKRDAVLVRDDPLQVCAAPPHHAIGFQIGTGLDDRIQFLQLVLAQPGRATAPGLVAQTVRTFRIEAMDPIAQRLTVHAGRRRGIRARLTVHHERNRQKAASLGHVPARPSQTAQIVGAFVRPCDRKPNRHRQPPLNRTQANQKSTPVSTRVRISIGWYKPPSAPTSPERPTRRKAKPAGELCPEDFTPRPSHYAKAEEWGRPAAWVDHQAEMMGRWSRANANNPNAWKSSWDQALHVWMGKHRDDGRALVVAGSRGQGPPGGAVAPARSTSGPSSARAGINTALGSHRGELL